ncbi:MAG: type II secretion system protein [Desulfococcaceae bacterium]
MGLPASRERGLTLLELTVAMIILSILAVGILPLSEVGYWRAREVELRRALRTIRDALDEYKALADQGKIAVDPSESGYPPDLESLVEGVPLTDVEGTQKKFLRRVPRDPMVPSGEWGLRSYADDPDGSVWGGQDVYDVYSTSDREALDGTRYSSW